MFLILLHGPDQRLIFGFFVPGGPQHHFRQHRREIDALGGEHVSQLSPVPRVRLGGDDFMNDQLLQTIGLALVTCRSKLDRCTNVMRQRSERSGVTPFMLFQKASTVRLR
jgi:hypothetical protein